MECTRDRIPSRTGHAKSPIEFSPRPFHLFPRRQSHNYDEAGPTTSKSLMWLCFLLIPCWQSPDIDGRIRHWMPCQMDGKMAKRNRDGRRPADGNAANSDVDPDLERIRLAFVPLVKLLARQAAREWLRSAANRITPKEEKEQSGQE
jgi:hypothetical protein